MEKFKENFVKVRSGNYFIIICVLFLTVWYGLKYIFNLEFLNSENLNVILSVEATLATSLLLDQSMKQAEADREILEEILQEEQQISELQEDIFEDLNERDNPKPRPPS